MRVGMDSSTRSQIFPCGLLAVTVGLALILSGCGRVDLQDYRPVQKVSAIPSDSTSGGDSTAQSNRIESGTSSVLPDAAVSGDYSVSALAPVNVVDGASVSNLLKVVPGDVPPASHVQPASATTSKPAEKTRTVELLIPDKSFQRDAASKAWRVSYDDLDLLKVLNLDPVTDNAVQLMPAWLKDLNGQRIRIRGFMFPTFEAEGIERFVLARDNQICCFGRDPKIYDLVEVNMRSGKTTNYIPATRAFDVIGRFKIEMVSEDGKPFGLYYIEDAEIIDR